MSNPAQGFSELDLADPFVKAVTELGYESPLPIQAACIPPLLEGKDILGLADTLQGCKNTDSLVLGNQSVFRSHAVDVSPGQCQGFQWCHSKIGVQGERNIFVLQKETAGSSTGLQNHRSSRPSSP